MTWYNNSWNYRKAITVSNTGSVLTDYQVSITIDTASLVTAGKMRSDCGDIRFIDTDDSTLLSYWIESIPPNSASTKIWVKIPSIPSSKTIYMYYGNASITSASNGKNTMVSYYDFTDANDLTYFTKAFQGVGINIAIVTDARAIYGGKMAYWTMNGTYPCGGQGSMAIDIGTVNKVYMRVGAWGHVGTLCTGFVSNPNVTLQTIDWYSGFQAAVGVPIKFQAGTDCWLGPGYGGMDILFVRKYTATEPTVSVEPGEQIPPGSLRITSTPSGALIYVALHNQTPTSTGIYTPDPVTNLSPGYYDIRLTRNGYADWTFANAQITSNTETQISATMITLANITATNMTVSPPSESPCRAGICTVGVSVTWTNNGGSTGSFVPSITVGSGTVTPTYPSEQLAAGAPVTHLFTVSSMTVGTWSICPNPN